MPPSDHSEGAVRQSWPPARLQFLEWRAAPNLQTSQGGCLELVAGSHRGPWLLPRTFLTSQARWFPEGSLAELPDIDADREAYDIRQFQLGPGDVILLDFLTVHGAPGFPFDARRRVLSLRYLAARRAARTAPLADLAAVRRARPRAGRGRRDGPSAVPGGLS